MNLLLEILQEGILLFLLLVFGVIIVRYIIIGYYMPVIAMILFIIIYKRLWRK